jgi:hypothetical protein
MSGLTGFTSQAVKTKATLDHLKSVWPDRNIEQWTWWDLLYALIIKGHTEEFEMSTSRLVGKLEELFASGVFIPTLDGSILNGGNIDVVNKIIAMLDPFLEPGEDKIMEKSVWKLLTGKHDVGKKGDTQVSLLGRGELGDNLTEKLRSIKDITWARMKKEIRDFARIQDGMHRALEACGELKFIKQDVLKLERKLQAKEERKAKDADKKKGDQGKSGSISQVSSNPAKMLCKCCGSENHWAFNAAGTAIECEKFKDIKDAEKKAKIEADLKAWKAIVDQRKAEAAAKAAAGKGQGRPPGKG